MTSRTSSTQKNELEFQGRDGNIVGGWQQRKYSVCVEKITIGWEKRNAKCIIYDAWDWTSSDVRRQKTFIPRPMCISDKSQSTTQRKRSHFCGHECDFRSFLRALTPHHTPWRRKHVILSHFLALLFHNSLLLSPTCLLTIPRGFSPSSCSTLVFGDDILLHSSDFKMNTKHIENGVNFIFKPEIQFKISIAFMVGRMIFIYFSFFPKVVYDNNVWVCLHAPARTSRSQQRLTFIGAIRLD